jgi:fucose 4-O-acetylase-like acetyltransferase
VAPGGSVIAEPDAGREAWIDILRLVVIVGVVGSHVAAIYALDISWYYEELTASEVAKAILAAVFAPGLLFGMGLMFFIAGLFTPPALERKGTRRFIIDRLWRLGLPTVAYLVVVNPALNFFGDRAEGEGETVSDYLQRTYTDDIELGVAWFMGALLMFSFAYALWRSRHLVATREVASPLRGGDLLKVAAFIAGASFLVRLQFPVLSGNDTWGFNLWEYPQVAAMFALGVVARERMWLYEGLSPRLRQSCGRAAVVGVVLAAVLGAAIAITDDADRFLGGLHVEATLIPLIEATLALGMSRWIIDGFRRHGSRAGPFVHGLGRATFIAYLVHAPITIALAIVLRDVGVPAEVKFLGVLGAGLAGSFGLGWLMTRSRRTARIL